jgi:hypothetical protein
MKNGADYIALFEGGLVLPMSLIRGWSV